MAISGGFVFSRCLWRVGLGGWHGMAGIAEAWRFEPHRPPHRKIERQIEWGFPSLPAINSPHPTRTLVAQDDNTRPRVLALPPLSRRLRLLAGLA